MLIDPAAAHAAVEARDRRFDGRFVTGVVSTGIYCRCVCPARPPRPENRRFYPGPAAAEAAGFRPCLVCRPELAPGASPMEAQGRLAAQALARIEAGALDGASATDLAAELGVSDRWLRRALVAAFGVGPNALAQTHRRLTAKRLLADTDLPITEVAYASGFGSLRRFNAAIKSAYAMTPQQLRRARRVEGGRLRLKLIARGAFDADAAVAFHAGRLVAGLEALTGPTLTRTLALGDRAGLVRLTFEPDGVLVEASEDLAGALRPLLAAVRGAYDLDADLPAIAARVAPPGAVAGRLLGFLDPFEAAVRTVLGQQVSIAAAATLAGRLVARFGEAAPEPAPGAALLFPTPARLAEAGAAALAELGLPGRRAACLHALATAVASGRCVLRRGAIAKGRAGLADVPGVGPWTLEYVALRGLGDPDAFPAGDLVLQRVAGTGRALSAAAERWRPWRGYAAIALWRAAATKGA